MTIPSVLGESLVIKTIETLLKVARASVRPENVVVEFDQVTNSERIIQQTRAVDTLAEEWPEYVLGPSNPLTYLDPEMPCSIFDVT